MLVLLWEQLNWILNCGNLFIFLKQLDQALAAYDKAVESNSNYRVTYYNNAGIYAKKTSPLKLVNSGSDTHNLGIAIMNI